MNHTSDGTRRVCDDDSKVDPMKCPATAAVEKMGLLADKEQLWISFLSERDDGFYRESINNLGSLQNKQYRRSSLGSFDLVSLSKATSSIIKGPRGATKIQSRRSRRRSEPPFSQHDPITSNRILRGNERGGEDRMSTTSENRRLVRCLACFELKNLDSSSGEMSVSSKLSRW